MPFVQQTSFDVEYAPTHITKWRSSRTGLQLTYIDQPSPVVNGYFAVATEIENDSGCPHTLEHLVFMGSKKYPYKGLLDSLGNRFFSSTNAWTSVDQTVYTLTTAGWEGFKTLLPIYLDHLFHPTLTDEACLTEVYHIDGKGKEKGVVFSEMQGIENQSWFLTYLNLQKALYAEKSGYSSETGGLMKELRHLTNDQIRDFHKTMYRPDNLCVVITGTVDMAELLAVMTEFDNELDALVGGPSRRPFIDSPHDMPLERAFTKSVDFPDEDESMGEVVIGWIGPECNDLLTNLAVDMVGEYLTDTPISLLNKILVEVEDPLATEVVYGTDDFVRTGLNFTISGVPTEHLQDVADKVISLLTEQTDSSVFDIGYMKQVVAQQKLKYVADAEKAPGMFANMAILEFIYGNPDGSDLSNYMKDLKEYEELSTWSAHQWCALVKQYFVDNKPVVILGVPSAQMNKTHKQELKERSKEIKREYGEEGLAELGRKLNDAQELNDTPIPEDVLTSLGKPDASKINFITTDSYLAQQKKPLPPFFKTEGPFFDLIASDSPNNFPLSLDFENYKSKFITVHLVMSSAGVPKELLRYLSIMEEIFSLSIELPNGTYIPYNEVIANINNDLVEFELDNGFENLFVELLSVKIKFEASNYEKGIEWLINALKYSVFEETRVKVIIEKIINSLPDKKRNDELMMYSKQHRTVYNDASIRKAQDSMYTEDFYKDLLEQINDGKYAQIEKDLNTIRNCLFSVNNMQVFVIGGCTQLKTPVSAWSEFARVFQNVDSPDFSLDHFPRAFQFKSAVGSECSGKAFLVSSSAGETTHLNALTPIPTDYMDEDIFKIALASEFLGGVEGPFWRGIRGTGLAYGANIRRLVESGYLTFNIYRGADAAQAWTTGKQIISDYTSGKLEIDDVSIENSIAAICNELANAESNAYDAATNKISNAQFKKVGTDYLKHFLHKLESYTSEDLVYIMKKYFLPLFDARKSLIFSCIPSSKSDEFSLFLVEQGYDVSLEEITAAHVDEHDCHSCCSHDESESGSEGSDSEEEVTTDEE